MAKVTATLAVVIAWSIRCTPGPGGTTVEAGPEAVTVQGVLEGRQGGGQFPCVWVRTAAGEQIEVAWPDGWSFDDDPPFVADAAGNVVARGGDLLTIDGTWAQAGATLCGIGRQLHADRVSRS